MAAHITCTICSHFCVTVHIKLCIYLFLILTIFDYTSNIYYYKFHATLFCWTLSFPAPCFSTSAIHHDWFNILIFYGTSQFFITLTIFTALCNLLAAYLIFLKMSFLLPLKINTCHLPYISKWLTFPTTFHIILPHAKFCRSKKFSPYFGIF